jgi:predicted RNA-binding Zn ribbon-like protein
VLDQASFSLALDFANTADWHAGDDPEERLISYEAAIAWAQEHSVLDDAQRDGLVARAVRHPKEAREALARIVRLREAVYRIFSAVAREEYPEEADLRLLHAELGEALVHLRLVGSTAAAGAADSAAAPAGGPRFEWAWAGMEDDLVSLLWPVARSAASLLTSSRLDRVRECAGHPCGWLFLDQSKNASRRWCDMADCGNRAKARRYRERKKAEGEDG